MSACHPSLTELHPDKLETGSELSHSKHALVPGLDAGGAAQRELCILAVDHDRCAAHIAKSEAAEAKTAELAKLLFKWATTDKRNRRYMLVTFSNRQTQKINEWMGKRDDPPHVNIAQLYELQMRLTKAEEGLADRLEVYPYYVLPASYFRNIESKVQWEAKLKKEMSKKDIVNEILKLFKDESRLFIFVDDNFDLLPTPSEKGVFPEVHCIQFAPLVMGNIQVVLDEKLF